MPPAYAAALEPLRPTAQLWRLAIGLPFVAGVYMAWMIGLGVVLWLALGLDGFEATLARIGAGADPWSLLLLLSTFVGGWLGLVLALRLLHRGLRLRVLLGRAPMVLRDFTLGVAIMALVGGGLAALATPLLPPLERATPLGTWLTFLPWALLGILIQTGAEELFFRGYMQGFLAARFGRALLAMVLPSLAFGLAHYSPGPQVGANAWLIVLVTGYFGLIASDLTLRTANLGLAWGLHFANNVLAILVVSVMGGLSGLALLSPPGGGASEAMLRDLLILDLVLMTAVWGACRVWLRRR